MGPEAREKAVAAQSADVAETHCMKVRPTAIENIGWELSITAPNTPNPELDFGMRTGMQGADQNDTRTTKMVMTRHSPISLCKLNLLRVSSPHLTWNHMMEVLIPRSIWMLSSREWR